MSTAQYQLRKDTAEITVVAVTLYQLVLLQMAISTDTSGIYLQERQED
jgi:uncharacterized membrane protein